MVSRLTLLTKKGYSFSNMLDSDSAGIIADYVIENVCQCSTCTDNLLILISNLNQCSYYNRKICKLHYELGKKNNKKYRMDNGKSMCNMCCWFEVS